MVAACLGGTRVPVTGRQRGDVPDVEHPTMSVEVKHWQKVPASLKTPLAQARAAAKGGKVPVVVLHEAGRPHKEALVVVALGDFARLIGRAESAAEVA